MSEQTDCVNLSIFIVLTTKFILCHLPADTRLFVTHDVPEVTPVKVVISYVIYFLWWSSIITHEA